MPPPLTSEELRVIQREERKERSSTIRRLLWEVFRLRAIALRADQFERAMRADHASLDFNSAELVARSLREDLDELPFIAENAQRQERMSNPPKPKQRLKRG